MSTKTTYYCDFCGCQMEPRDFKINVLIEAYTPGSGKPIDLVHHEGDCCKECDQNLVTRLKEVLQECNKSKQ